MFQLTNLLVLPFAAAFIIGCSKSIPSPIGSWKGEIKTEIDSEGKKMQHTSKYNYTLNKDGSCSIIVETIWDIDGFKTKNEFEGSWQQESNTITVNYNLLDNKKVSDYATTPRNWNEVRHVYKINNDSIHMHGEIEKTKVKLEKNLNNLRTH